MERVAVETGESVVLFTHRQHQVQVLALKPGRTTAPANIMEGATLPVFGRAAGGAVLMVKDHAELFQTARSEERREGQRGEVRVDDGGSCKLNKKKYNKRKA